MPVGHTQDCREKNLNPTLNPIKDFAENLTGSCQNPDLNPVSNQTLSRFNPTNRDPIRIQSNQTHGALPGKSNPQFIGYCQEIQPPLSVQTLISISNPAGTPTPNSIIPYLDSNPGYNRRPNFNPTHRVVKEPCRLLKRNPN